MATSETTKVWGLRVVGSQVFIDLNGWALSMTNTPENRETARLLVAAPALRDALKEVEDVLRNPYSDDEQTARNALDLFNFGSAAKALESLEEPKATTLAEDLLAVFGGVPQVHLSPRTRALVERAKREVEGGAA